MEAKNAPGEPPVPLQSKRFQQEASVVKANDGDTFEPLTSSSGVLSQETNNRKRNILSSREKRAPIMSSGEEEQEGSRHRIPSIQSDADFMNSIRAPRIPSRAAQTDYGKHAASARLQHKREDTEVKEMDQQLHDDTNSGKRETKKGEDVAPIPRKRALIKGVKSSAKKSTGSTSEPLGDIRGMLSGKKKSGSKSPHRRGTEDLGIEDPGGETHKHRDRHEGSVGDALGSDEELFNFDSPGPSSQELRSAKELLKDDESHKAMKSAIDSLSIKSGILNKRFKPDGDDYLEMMKRRSVFDPKQSRNIEYADLNQDISVGLQNEFEEVDEQANEVKQQAIVKRKYGNEEFPGTLSLGEIEQKANQHMDCIPKILDGRLDSTYLQKAKVFMHDSGATILSNADLQRPSFKQFFSGFYGLKRQGAIANLIRRKYHKLIKEKAEHNRVIQFWSIDTFTLHILAPEVAARMAAEDMSISIDEAIRVLDRTVDYGQYIADLVPCE